MSWLITAWAVIAAGFTGVALFRLNRREHAKRVSSSRAVLLLRPVDAPTALELENLSAPIDSSRLIKHVVLSPFRPRSLPTNVEWLPSDPVSRNRKVGHLAYALASIAGDATVLCVDADVRVDAELIDSLVGALEGGAALASAAPRPQVIGTVAGRAHRGLLVQSHHSFEALDVMSAGAKAICGKAIALSPEAAHELVQLADCIGEDLELAQVLHARGLNVVLADATAQVPQVDHASLRPLVDRFTRWMQVLRAHRPALFPTVPLFFASTPVLMVLTAMFFTPTTASALALLVVLRTALASHLDARRGVRFEWLLGETLLLACWVRSLFLGRTVEWRGRRFELSEGGRMRAVIEEGSAT